MEAHLHEVLGDLEQLGDRRRVQLLDVAEQQHLAVALRKPVDGIAHELAQLPILEQLVRRRPR